MTFAITKCDLVRVVDGDTLVLSIPVWYGLSVTSHVRLEGIDAPELKSPGGLESKEYLRSLIDGKLDLVARGLDKYGRIVGTLYNEGTAEEQPSLNTRMLLAGQAAVYELNLLMEDPHELPPA